MKGNADKCHLLVSSNEKVTIKIGSHEIANDKSEKSLGVHLDIGLTCDYHISEICKEATREVFALNQSNITHEVMISDRHLMPF